MGIIQLITFNRGVDFVEALVDMEYIASLRCCFERVYERDSRSPGDAPWAHSAVPWRLAGQCFFFEKKLCVAYVRSDFGEKPKEVKKEKKFIFEHKSGIYKYSTHLHTRRTRRC